MALQTAALKTGIKDLLSELFTNAGGLTSEQAQDRFADQLSTLMETYVKSSQLNVPGLGLIAGSNPVTGTSTTGTIT